MFYWKSNPQWHVFVVSKCPVHHFTLTSGVQPDTQSVVSLEALRWTQAFNIKVLKVWMKFCYVTRLNCERSRREEFLLKLFTNLQTIQDRKKSSSSSFSVPCRSSRLLCVFKLLWANHHLSLHLHHTLFSSSCHSLLLSSVLWPPLSFTRVTFFYLTKLRWVQIFSQCSRLLSL